MKYIALLLLGATMVLAQQGVSVQVTGYGVDAASAERDALRAAVERAVGTKIKAWTQVENFKPIEDVILSHSEGYISSHEVVGKPKQGSDKRWEVTIDALVSLSPMEQDSKTLAQWLGGLQFLTWFDPGKLKAHPDSEYYSYAYERMNEYLKRNGYRYIERKVLDRIITEMAKIAGIDTSSADFAKKLAYLADAEFYIDVSNIVLRTEEKGLGITQYKGTIDAKSYDNCTDEGLGTIVGEGDTKFNQDETEGWRKAIDGAAYNAGEKIMYLTANDLWDWCRNGAPFEIRFYGANEDKIDNLIIQLRKDPDFGGQLSPTGSGDYWHFNCTFKKTPFDMKLKVREIAAAVGLPVDTRLMYGRQLTFAPQAQSVPELDPLINLKPTIEAGKGK